MQTCNDCAMFDKGNCLNSGFEDCAEEDLLKVKKDDPPCDWLVEK